MKLLPKAILCLAAVAAVSLPSPAGQKPTELKMNIAATETSSGMVAAREFKRLVEEGTDGKYVINIYPNEQLASGNQVKGLEMLFKGIIDCDMHSAMTMPSFEPRIQVCFLPWIFRNGYESVDEIIFNGAGGEMIMQLFREKGAVPLALGENGFRHITNNVRELKTPDDFRDLKIRVPPLPLYIDLFKLLGADPVVMNFTELFTSLQQ
ncbi:MAG: TRAP transporter substrate-binding protein DctP, partial [Planctomycetes bacterium]|nr:TRAP transporter substrate-binding protein DctP [Planctomycetota bacterium]